MRSRQRSPAQRRVSWSVICRESVERTSRWVRTYVVSRCLRASWALARRRRDRGGKELSADGSGRQPPTAGAPGAACSTRGWSRRPSSLPRAGSGGRSSTPSAVRDGPPRVTFRRSASPARDRATAVARAAGPAPPATPLEGTNALGAGHPRKRRAPTARVSASPSCRSAPRTHLCSPAGCRWLGSPELLPRDARVLSRSACPWYPSFCLASHRISQNGCPRSAHSARSCVM